MKIQKINLEYRRNMVVVKMNGQDSFEIDTNSPYSNNTRIILSRSELIGLFDALSELNKDLDIISQLE